MKDTAAISSDASCAIERRDRFPRPVNANYDPARDVSLVFLGLERWCVEKTYGCSHRRLAN
jgi:hypothetical protein